MKDEPSHPLVVDKTTGLCRLATQEDIRGLELIALNYRTMIELYKIALAKDNDLRKALKDPYYGGEEKG